MRKILFCLFLSIVSLFAEAPFGYLSYSTTNIGDDIQSIAARRFLPSNSVPINREFIGEFTYPEPVNAIVNGWFMHTKDLWWYREDILPPKKSWPPSEIINPLFISIHFIKPILPKVLSKQGIEYLKRHAPIGARDYYTLKMLQRKGIPSYFSGCLTLTLDNPLKDQREDVIYAVDISSRCLQYLKRHARSEVVSITHGVPQELFWENDPEKRFAYAEEILNRYRKAKCVITSRLHASMPCLAFETPVLLIGRMNNRFGGLRELVHHCTEGEFYQGLSGFDFNHPPENLKDYLPLRDNLIQMVEDWVSNISRSKKSAVL